MFWKKKTFAIVVEATTIMNSTEMFFKREQLKLKQAHEAELERLKQLRIKTEYIQTCFETTLKEVEEKVFEQGKCCVMITGTQYEDEIYIKVKAELTILGYEFSGGEGFTSLFLHLKEPKDII